MLNCCVTPYSISRTVVNMAFTWLLRLRRLQRLSKLIIFSIFACTTFYFLVLLYKKTPYLWELDGGFNTSVNKPAVVQVIKGKLSVHVWREICGSEVRFLQNSPLFPSYPHEKRFITEFQVEDEGVEYGQKIFGFIEPPTTDLYRFAISSDDSSELWLGPKEDPSEKKLIARVYSKGSLSWTGKRELQKYSDQISSQVLLQAEKRFYIEALHKQGTGQGFVEVYWANSKPGSEFKIITSEFVSAYANDSTVTGVTDFQHDVLSVPKNVNERLKLKRKKYRTLFKKDFLEMYRLPLLTEDNFLPPCAYKSSFVVKDTLYRYNGIYMVYESNVYPLDDTDMGYKDRVWSWPNRVADKQLVHLIVDKMIASLQQKTAKNYFLKRIHKVLQKSDPLYGDRFSVDLEVGLRDGNQSAYRLSRHVYLAKGSTSLCFPEGINWNNNATVYFILPVKDQGKWVYHFINQLSDASLLTGDTNFHVVVIDFESQDIDMKKAFNTSLLRSRHTVVNLQGKFYKTLALNKGVELVPSPHDIVLLFDLHIDVPADLLDSVRKNTIEGRIAYFPVVGRLDCQSTADDHYGFWQLDGYGIVGVYKSDWIRFGGMNSEEYTYDWGGEDWDLLDRMLNVQLEVERVKQPRLFHHFHTVQKNWN